MKSFIICCTISKLNLEKLLALNNSQTQLFGTSYFDSVANTMEGNLEMTGIIVRIK